MIDHSPHQGIKGEVEHLWRSNKPLAITILVGLAVLGYVIYKRQQGSVTTAGSSTSAQGTPGMFYQTYITNTKNVTQAAPSPVTPGPVPTPGQTAPLPLQPGPPTSPNPTGSGTNRITPIIPYNALPPGTRYSTAADLQAQPNLVWMGTTYKKMPGSNGLLWGQPVNGGPQVLLYGPPSAYS